MSFFGDALDFEGFQLKDWWRKIKDNPEQLLIGAGDPWSTKMWNEILDKDYEPFVDQMGGPYGGHTISAFGDNDGGVYKRAREAGIDTDSAGDIHSAAHVIAGLLAGGYGASALGGGGGAAGAAGGGAGGSAAPGALASGGIPAGIEGVTVTASGGSGALPAVGGAAAGAGAGSASGGEEGYDWQRWTRSAQQQQQNSQPKQNAYDKFLENQNKAMRVARALSEQDRASPSDDFQQQVAKQRQRRAIAQAMMQGYA